MKVKEETMVVCPYSVDHFIPVADMLLHLAKCRRRYYKRFGIKTELKRCKYNGCHLVPVPELTLHELICSNRALYLECKEKMRYPPIPLRTDDDQVEAGCIQPSVTSQMAVIMDISESTAPTLFIEGGISRTSYLETICPAETVRRMEENVTLCGSTDGNFCRRCGSVPGPNSCVFLEMALKRLYAREDFDVLESLGEGFFGDVYKVQHRMSGEIMVLKVGKERERENRTQVKANVLKEVDVLNQLTSHPNLLAFRGVCVDLTEKSWNLHILMDFCDAGSLSRLICDHQKCFRWSLRCSLARDISYAMDFVHSKNIMHRDLTSMNVLLQTVTNGTVKAVVADFGLSCKIPRDAEKLIQVGTPYWMAPECLKEEFYDEKADVFSFGIILCQMIARIDADPEAGLYRTHNFGLDHVRFTAHCPVDTPLDILNLAFQCCLMDPTARPSFASVYGFFSESPLSLPKNYDESTMLLVESGKQLVRSSSDATLRYSNSKQSELFQWFPAGKEQDIRSQNSHSKCKSANSVPLLALQEGISYGDLNRMHRDEETRKKSRMEKLARSVAVDELSNELSLDSGNPFMTHEIYKKTRKLAFPEMDDRKRCLVSDAKKSDNSNKNVMINVHSDLVNCGNISGRTGNQAISMKKSGHPKWISKNVTRRSMSLPSQYVTSADALSWMRYSTTFDPLLPSSSSAGLIATATLQRGRPDIGEQCALKGKMSIAFKNEDQKFTSRRYPSRRRYTVLNGTLLSTGCMTEQWIKDFSLSVDETVLSRDTVEPTFEHSKSDCNFSSFLQHGNDVVIEQSFSAHSAASKSSEENSGTRITLFQKGTDRVQNPGKDDNKRYHIQAKQDTVVHDRESVNAAVLDSFCAAGRRYTPCRKKRISNMDNRPVSAADEYCAIL